MSLRAVASLGLFSLLACTALLALACGDDEQAAPVEEQDFCPSFALAVCEGVRDCCMDPQLGFDACVASESDRCDAEILRAGGIEIGLGVLGSLGTGLSDELEYDPQHGGTVVERARGAAKTCTQLPYPSYADVYVVASTVPDADTRCLSRQDCDPGYYCDFSNRSGARGTPGDCVRLPGEAQPCTSECAGALVCFAESGSSVQVCVAPREEGESCFDDAQCAGGSFCESATFGRGGVCVAQKENGAACDSDSQCESDYCAGRTACALAPNEPQPVEPWCELEPD